MTNSTFRAAWWLPGPHLPTIYGKFFREVPAVPSIKERWDTPDGDLLTLHRLAGQPDAPRLVILHGLEGGAHATYARAFLYEAHRRGWGADLIVFRTCDEPVNRVRRSYHSGETTDLAFVVDRLLREHPGQPIVLAGVSLGGNVLCKWLGEHGDAIPAEVRAAGAVSVPFDLGRASRHIDSGFSRVYSKYFLTSLIAKTVAKAERFPDLIDVERVRRARTLWDFDDAATGPMHGFRDAQDYYTRCSSIGFLPGIRRPTLLLSSFDDPFMPRTLLDDVHQISSPNPWITREFTERGGHVGFIGGSHPKGASYYAEARVVQWLADQLAESSEATVPSALNPSPAGVPA
jgi:predicted alpha/beta-fold hydrolase